METDIKVGLFVTLGMGLIMLAIILLGGAKTLLTSQTKYHTHLENAEGLISGSKILLDGIQVGLVDDIYLDTKTRSIRLELAINSEYQEWIREDSAVQLVTQGVLGDKFVALTAGGAESPMLKPGAEIRSEASKNLGEFLSDGEAIIGSLTKVSQNLERITQAFIDKNRHVNLFEGMSSSARNLAGATEKLNHQMENMKLRQAVNRLNSILSKIDNGSGTLGALINDPSLYDEARALVGGVNRNRIMRNMVRLSVKESIDRKADRQINSDKKSEK